MIALSIASSIDALIVGVTFAFLKINIVNALLVIGATTFIISFVGVLIGNIVGKKLGNKANMLGGIVLILIGVKTLIQHLFF